VRRFCAKPLTCRVRFLLVCVLVENDRASQRPRLVSFNHLHPICSWRYPLNAGEKFLNILKVNNADLPRLWRQALVRPDIQGSGLLLQRGRGLGQKRTKV
jgi:hypothetical protein